MFDVNEKPQYLLVEYGRRTYAFGLPWFSSDEEESPRKQAVALIKRLNTNFDLYAERTGEFPQYSIASSAEGMKQGAISAANAIANMLSSESWLYVAEIQDTIWITYGRSNLIMPEGDKVYTDVDEAKQAFKDLNPSRFKSVSVPASWRNQPSDGSDGPTLITSDIEESDTADIFRKPDKTAAKLTAISSTKTIVKLLGGVLLIGAAGYIALQLLVPSATGPTQDELDAQAEILRQQELQRLQEVYAGFDANKPWEQLPQPIQLSNSCLLAIQEMPLSPAGYALTDIECSDGQIVGNYTRENSHPSWLREWGASNPTYTVDVDLETSNGFLSRILETAPLRGPENLENFLVILRTLIETDLYIEGTLTYTQPIQYVYEEYPEYIPLYGTSDLVITTTEPEQWINALERVPGIAIERVKLSVVDNIYTFEGDIYVKNRDTDTMPTTPAVPEVPQE